MSCVRGVHDDRIFVQMFSIVSAIEKGGHAAGGMGKLYKNWIEMISE